MTASISRSNQIQLIAILKTLYQYTVMGSFTQIRQFGRHFALQEPGVETIYIRNFTVWLFLAISVTLGCFDQVYCKIHKYPFVMY